MKRLMSLAASVFVLAVSHVSAHICDNVWRQADKLIIKPEISNLVLKDKASFKVYVQSNMDRGIVRNMQLVGNSDAFDVTVAPAEGHRIVPGQKFEYDVTLTLKKGMKSGEYPVRFDAVVNDRVMKSETIGPASQPAGLPAVANKVRIMSGTTPQIDGLLKDNYWSTALILKPKAPAEISPAQLGFTGLLSADSANIYVFISSKKSKKGAPPYSKTGSLAVLLSPPGSDDVYKIAAEQNGSFAAAVCRNGRETPLTGQQAGIKCVTKEWVSIWDAELCIPVSALGATAKIENQKWRMNVVQKSDKEQGEANFWSGTDNNHATPDGLGEVTFSR